MGGFSVRAEVLFDLSPLMPERMERKLDEVADHSAVRIAENAAAIAPKRTGELAGDYVVTGSGGEREVSNTSDHWKYVEFGTRKMAAEPSLGPATREEEGPFRDAAAKAVEEVAAL